MLSIGLIGEGHGSPGYYVEQVADGREDYYTGHGEATGRWLGAGAVSANLAGPVDSDAFLALLTPRGQANQRVVGFDLTFSAPKSVSVLFGVAEEVVSREVRDGHDAAVEQAVGYLEGHATWTRRGRNGHQRLLGNGLTIAAFRHRSSRAGDPQLHTHAVAANATVADGRTTTLDSRTLFKHAKTAGFVYQAALRAELTQRLGLAWGPVEQGVAEVEGVDPEVRAHFSRRSHEIAEHLQEHGGRSRRARELAALETRQAKQHDPPVGRLREDWRARAAEHGLDRAELDALLHHGLPRHPDLARDAAHLASPEGITQKASTFTRRDAVRAWGAPHRDGVDAERLGRLTDRWLASDHAIRIARDLDSEQSRYSTPELLRTESDLIDGALERRASGAGRVSPETVAQAIDRTPRLSGEQRDAVRTLNTSGDGVQVVRAAAGTGKTTMLTVARDAWEAEGHRVYGCALSARAALELETSAGIDASTIARLRRDLDDGHRLPAGSVLVVDEAGMVDSRTIAALAEHAATAQAKLVLVGDDHQLPEINTGGAFRGLADRLDAVELREVHRQDHAWDKTALEHLRHGRVEEWAAAYREHDRITALPDPEEVRDRLVEDWWTSRQDPEVDAVMIAHRRADVTDLNDRARARLQASGQLDLDELKAARRGYTIGDRVLARRNDRQLGIVNGTRAFIQEINSDTRSVDIELHDGTRTTIGAGYLDAGHLHHGYAISAHTAQGVTVDHTFVLGTEDLYREWGYTAMTRHTETARFYTVSPASTERALQPENNLTEGERALDASRAKLLALDQADPRLDNDTLRAALTAPPPVVTKRIGDRPHGVLDREQWIRAADTLLRDPSLDLTRTPDLAGPAEEIGMDMGL